MSGDEPLLTEKHTELYKQYPGVLFVWKTEEGACEICQALDGLGFTFDQVLPLCNGHIPIASAG